MLLFLILFSLFKGVSQFYIILFLSNPKMKDKFLNKVKTSSKKGLDAA